MSRARAILVTAVLAMAALLAASANSQAAECEPKASCFGLESVGAAISTHQAGAHPDLTLDFAARQDPESKPNVFGLHKSYAPVRDVRIETPPGFVGDPNVLGVPQQCTVQELVNWQTEGCPNGSQIGISTVTLYGLPAKFTEPIYMMAPPEGSDVVARLGLIAGIYVTFVDLRVRSEDQHDYGLSAEISGTPPEGEFVEVDSTLWGVPAAKAHDGERCTPLEAFNGCTESVSRPPGSRPLSFLTNPTSCGAALPVTVNADSWVEPGRFVSKSAELPPITGCDKLPFNPSLAVEPTSHRAGAPTGLELSFRLPAPEGVGVLESAELKDLRIDFPPGMGVNSASADGLGTCSAAQVGFGHNEAAHCPDSAKLGDTEFDVPALPRRMKGSIYLREPEPGHLFRVWVVADDLGAHVKLPGELEVDEGTGQIHSIVLGVPQVPVREVRLLIKSGFRAPLVNPQRCGTYQTHWEFTPWSGTGAVGGDTPMRIDEGCDAGGFDPKLSAGSTDPTAGAHSPFVFALTRQDGEGNPAALDITLPKGLAATFAGVARCEGAAALTGACPPASRIGRVLAATGAGPTPLWVPQPGKRPTAVYLAGPYKGAPLSVVAVVPAQAGPFDLGDQVVRNAVYVDPLTAQATAKSDPLPQMIQGIPVYYRTIEVVLDRPGFALNPTGCARGEVGAAVTSVQGALARPSTSYAAADCAKLGFKPRLSLKLKGGTKRGSFPALRATFRPREGDANAKDLTVLLPHSTFLEQGHIRTICTRVQFAANGGGGAGCPTASIYGHVVAHTPLFEFPLEGPAYLRSSSHNLPDLVFALHGPPSMPIQVEAVGRIDSVKGGIRSSFESIPDAPLAEVLLEMEGGQKGLIVNSTNICKGAHRAEVDASAQNGKRAELRPEVRASCPKGQRKHKRKGN
jgi:hypothetical protein